MLGDCHVHMVLDGVDYKKAMGSHKPVVQEDWIRAKLSEYRSAGVTYVRDGGDALRVCERARELAPEYGIEYRIPHYPICRKGRYGGFIGRCFEDFGEYRALVDEVVRRNGDFIKIMISGLMDFNHYGVITSTPLDKQEIADMIAYAHDRGMAVMAHANGAETILNALKAGVDSIEHGAYMNDECVSALAESGAVWTPTAVTIGNLIGCGRHDDGILKPLLALHLENARKCHALGGKIAAGSDAGAYQVPHVKGLADEIALLKSADISQEALNEAESIIRKRFRR